MTNDKLIEEVALLPCGFCAAAPINGMGYNWGQVACDTEGCIARGVYVWPDKWNTRATVRAHDAQGNVGAYEVQQRALEADRRAHDAKPTGEMAVLPRGGRITPFDVYFEGVCSLPEDVKSRLSIYHLREIWKHMVEPALTVAVHNSQKPEPVELIPVSDRDGVTICDYHVRAVRLPDGGLSASVWIQHNSGEGGSFPAEPLADLIGRFFNERF